VRIAFYAPLKPPDHPVPSGDRRIAELLLSALQRAGHQPFIASRLRSFDGDGNPDRQARIAALGKKLAGRLLQKWRQSPDLAPRAWFTYHLYYKAPDWIGPRISAALGIPYIVAEASHAAKRADGNWALGHAAVARSIRRADAVIGLNSADRSGIAALLGNDERWVSLLPFLDATAYPASRRGPGSPTRLIAVAMMRPRDKLASYRLLGAALALLIDLPWTVEIIGDGSARDAVEHALAPLGDRVRYAGALDPNAVAARLAQADLFVWPAINEAFGMALLEAQACGLPVVAGAVAGAVGGVADIVAHEETGLLAPVGDVGALADATRALLLNPAARLRMGTAARDKVAREHDIGVAAARLQTLIASLATARAA
jgi:glycosyltransferase involved in cell wall biosynthesis